MPKRRVGGPLTAKQKAQRKVAAAASAAKRKKTGNTGKTPYGYNVRAASVNKGGMSTTVQRTTGPGGHSDVVSSTKSRTLAHRNARTAAKARGPVKQSPYAKLSSQGQAPKAKVPTKLAHGPQSTGPKAFTDKQLKRAYAKQQADSAKKPRHQVEAEYRKKMKVPDDATINHKLGVHKGPFKPRKRKAR